MNKKKEIVKFEAERPTNPDETIKVIDKFMSALMKDVPLDYSAEVIFRNQQIVSTPISKTFLGGAPKMNYELGVKTKQAAQAAGVV